MELRKVKFTIKPGGEYKMEVLEGQGESCLETTRELEVTLSAMSTQVDSGKKPEFYEGGSGISVFNDLK